MRSARRTETARKFAVLTPLQGFWPLRAAGAQHLRLLECPTCPHVMCARLGPLSRSRLFLHRRVISSRRSRTPSDRQVRANRSNARRSSGPRTAAGKRRASRNATSHDIYCRDLVLPGESHGVHRLSRLDADAIEPGGRLGADVSSIASSPHRGSCDPLAEPEAAQEVEEQDQRATSSVQNEPTAERPIEENAAGASQIRADYDSTEFVEVNPTPSTEAQRAGVPAQREVNPCHVRRT
jgi:hypothetical protein